MATCTQALQQSEQVRSRNVQKEIQNLVHGVGLHIHGREQGLMHATQPPPNRDQRLDTLPVAVQSYHNAELHQRILYLTLAYTYA